MKMSSISEISELREQVDDTVFKKAPVPKPRVSKTVVARILKSEPSVEKISTASTSERYATSSNVTAQTDSKTYKDSLKSRFQQIKTKSGKSLIKAKQQSVDRSNTGKITLEELKQQNDLLSKKIANLNTDTNGGVSSSEKYSFFCEDTGDRQNADGVNDVLFWKAANMSELIDDSANANLELVPTSQVSSDKSIDTESDGIYRTSPTTIRQRKLNQLHCRLLQSDLNWFDRKHVLQLADNPQRAKLFKPFREVEDVTPIEYVVASNITVHDLPSEIIIMDRDSHLEISLKSVKFSHHPLFSAEHVLQRRLIDLYDSYRSATVRNSDERIIKQVEALRKTDSNKTQIIRDLQEEICERGKSKRKLIRELLITWKNIKKVRQRNGFSNTNVKLSITKHVPNLDEDEIKWDSDIKQVCHEIAESDPDGDLNEIERRVTQRFRESFRWPGEPILQFGMAYDNEIAHPVDKIDETTRRQAVASKMIYAKIIHNGEELGRTKSVALTDNFAVIFDEVISVKANNVKVKQLELEICEKLGNLRNRSLGRFHLQLSADPGNVQESMFETKFMQGYKHDAIGCGEDIMTKMRTSYELIQSENENPLYLSGAVFYGVNATIKSETTFAAVVSDQLLSDYQKLQQIDPEHPLNNKLLAHMKSKIENVATPKVQFRLDQHNEHLIFCDNAEIDNNIRFKLLRLRERNEPEFTGMVIPNRAKEIPDNVLGAYNRRIAQEPTAVAADDDDDLYQQDKAYRNEIIQRRTVGRRQLRLMHMKVFQQCKCHDNHLLFEDVVDEKSIAQIQLIVRTVIVNFFNWFKLRPGLRKPIPKIVTVEDATSKTASSSTSTSIPKIKIHLISAINMPKRKRSDKTDSTEDLVLRPFVEVTLSDATIESIVSEGSSPKWNEQLIVSLDSTSVDYLGPNSLCGSIHVNVFDELQPASESKERQVMWLGSLEVPISAIFSMPKLEGFFAVHSAYHFNYELEKGPNDNKSPNSNVAKTEQIMYIEMSMTVTPNVPKLTPDYEHTACNEPPFLKDHLLRWSHDYNLAHAERRFNTLVLDTSGRSTCITRYIRPLEPPQINRDGFDMKAEQIAKYVAAIPLTETNKFYEHIWLNTEQLLRLMVGTIYDHAVALTCYLLALNLEVWLLIGAGLPHGSCAYVLEREHVTGSDIPAHYIFDPTTGMKYQTTDRMNPCQRVYCVVNDQNIWANTQRENTVAMTRFDLARRFDWLPVFSSQVAAPTNAVQQRLVYTHTFDVAQLEATIEAKLRRRIMRARRRVKTVWNRNMSAQLKAVLKRFELEHMNHSRAHAFHDRGDELVHLTRNNKLEGCIVNTVFSKVSTLFDLINSTKSFAEDKDCELVFAAHIQPYPNHILNVWIVIATVSN